MVLLITAVKVAVCISNQNAESDSLKVDNLEEVKIWCVPYHGTTNSKAMSIMLCGVQVAHSQAYSLTCQRIYLSPSIEYAGHQ